MTKERYKELYNLHGAAAMAESFVFPVTLPPQQKEKADKELNAILNKRRAAFTNQEAMEATLTQLRFQMEDYIRDSKFDKKKNFGFFLKTYIARLNKKRNEFAAEIDINPTELSQYINSHRTPPTSIMIRLELHSHKIIPATDWYKLVEKEALHKLSTNKTLRLEQKQFVKKEAQLKVSA